MMVMEQFGVYHAMWRKDRRLDALIQAAMTNSIQTWTTLDI
jgi:hypothetical protein